MKRPDLLDTRVTIVGAGPIGLELAVALRREGIDFTLFDAASVGHTISWWAPQTQWFSSNERIAIAGVPLVTPNQAKATREQYLAYLRAVSEQFKIPVRTFCRVTGAERTAHGLRVLARSRGGPVEVTCEALVLAIGGTDHPRRLGIEGEDLPHVDGYLREPHRYFGRRVMIIGGRNSAVEGALRLHHAGARVCLSYRGDEIPQDHIKYWLYPEIRGLIRAGRIDAYFGTQPIRIQPSHVTLEEVGGKRRFDVEADDVLSLIGYTQDKTLLENIGVELEGEGRRPVFDESTMETNVRGVYVAGTAVAGTQSSRYKIFLENCHDHVDRIVAHLSGHNRSGGDEALQQQIREAPET